MKNTSSSTIFRLRVLAAGLGIVGLALTGCAGTGNHQAGQASAGSEQATEPDVDQFLAEQDLAGLDAVQVIDRLDAVPVAERSSELIASVRPGELVMVDAVQNQVSLPIPEDKFYLSIAPYTGQTHECHFHSLTTCLGEMQNTDVKVTVTDAKSGKTLVDEQRTTFDNGFVGLWLPRGIEGTVTIEADGRSASMPISTVPQDAATCLTTMQLT